MTADAAAPTGTRRSGRDTAARPAAPAQDPGERFAAVAAQVIARQQRDEEAARRKKPA